MKAPTKVDVLLGSGVLVLAATVAIMVASQFEPEPIKFKALDIVNSSVERSGVMVVVAETERLKLEKCTNGVQIDIRDSTGELMRAQVPARKIKGDMSRYDVIVPDAAALGQYQVRIRETWYCGGPPRIVDAPWLPFEIVG